MQTNWARDIRKITLEQSKRANVGHIGSALSIADILATLYGDILQIKNPQDPNRDRFILSKGHAALALYACLHLKGWITQDELNSYCGNDSELGVHPEHFLNGVEFSTGSLGQGLPMATGLALAARMQKKEHRVFVLMSDAECNEGSVWESVMFAAHHKLSNLVVIIDDNAQQAFGYTENVLDLSPLAEKFKAFGWDAQTIDGHNREGLIKTVQKLNSDKPHVLVAQTIFGKGVSYMESKIKWHYWPMSDEEFKIAIKEVGEAR